LNFIREKLNDKKLIHFPQYRRSYIFSKLPKWIKSARRALYELHEDIDYVISKNKEIVVVDYANTGVSQTNMHWSDGVHQFLQLKHNLRMTPERMCDSFYSNVTLFKKYQYLYGLSGTLGGKDAQEFIKKVYKIDVVIIPKYIDSKFEIYSGQYSIFPYIAYLFVF
jgi:preprotein translocase subunit SecA